MNPTLSWLSDPEIFEVNRERAHSDHSYKTKGGDLRQSLNGIWKFNYCEHPDDRPADFYKAEYDVTAFDEIKVRFPELYAARATDLTLPLPGAEEHTEGLIRFRRAMEEAARQAPGDFAVVAHGGVIGEFLKDITGQWRKPGYTEVIPLVWHEGQFRVMEEETYA